MLNIYSQNTSQTNPCLTKYINACAFGLPILFSKDMHINCSTC